MFYKAILCSMIMTAGATQALADGSQCSPAAADAAGYAAKAHLGEDAVSTFVLIDDPVQVEINDGEPWTSYQVKTTLPNAPSETYQVRVLDRTCKIISIVLQD